MSVLLVGVSARYELAIPLPKDDQAASSLLILALLIVLGVGVMVAVFGWAFGSRVLSWLNYASLDKYLWIVPLGLIAGGVYQALSYWSVRKKAFRRISQTKMRQSIGMLVTQIVLPFLVAGPFGLLMGDVVGRVSGTGTLAKGLDFQTLGRTRWHTMKCAAREYSRFPQVMLWAALVNMVGSQLPFLALPRFFGVEAVGFYFLAYRILSVPVSMISGAVSQVFFAEIAQDSDLSRVQEKTRNITDILITIGMPVYLSLVVIGPRAFEFFFGTDWTEAGQNAIWLAPMLIMRLLASTLSPLLTVGRRFGEALLFTVLELVTCVACIWIGVLYNSIRLFLIWQTILYLPLSIGSIWRFVRVAHINTFDLLWRALIKIAPINICAFLLVWLGVHLFTPPLAVLFWVIMVSCVLYASFRMEHVRLILSKS